jgi:hypothetical protein
MPSLICLRVAAACSWNGERVEWVGLISVLAFSCRVVHSGSARLHVLCILKYVNQMHHASVSCASSLFVKAQSCTLRRRCYDRSGDGRLALLDMNLCSGRRNLCKRYSIGSDTCSCMHVNARFISFVICFATTSGIPTLKFTSGF